ncbi:hypothetical protein GQ457_09G006520 [Hibiscus cannabinus]
MEELNLAYNADMDKQLKNHTVSDGELDTNCDKLEVADSEDDETRETSASGVNDCCASSCQRNEALECSSFKSFPLPSAWLNSCSHWISAIMGYQLKLQKLYIMLGHQVQGLVLHGDTLRTG